MSENVTYTDGSNTLTTANNIPFVKFKGFEELVPEYYGALSDILDRTKGVVLMVKLKVIYIKKLDFSIPITLDVPELDINGCFYINKISNYKQGFTAVEFVRL